MSLTWQSTLPAFGAQSGETPLHREAFLTALHQNGCLSATTGWLPHYLVADSGWCAFYEKRHSYGEFVFDWAWADAYQRHGLLYYPKLVAALPYTPVPGNKVYGDLPMGDIVTAAEQFSLQRHMSSVHWLYCDKATQASLTKQGYIGRKSVQFHWFNRDYADFSDFLDTFVSRKRKMVNKERRNVQHQGIRIERKTASNIDAQDLDFFYRCYRDTYQKRSGHNGYLPNAFFQQLGNTMSNELLLVLAYQDNRPVACALFAYDKDGLYGRYWGCIEEHEFLHFECCLYQGIEFCIEQNIPFFNPGTQGEHKLLRGFEPVWCYSAHKLHHPDFHRAINTFCLQEALQLEQYRQQALTLLPFKQQG